MKKNIFAGLGVVALLGLLIGAGVTPPGGGGAVSTLSDVSLSAIVTDGHVLAWDSTAGVWSNSAAGAGTGDFLADGTVPMTGIFDAGGNAVSNVLDLYVGNDAYFSNYVYFLGEIRSDMDMDQGAITNLGELDVSDIWMRGALKTDLDMDGNNVTNVLHLEVTGDLTVDTNLTVKGALSFLDPTGVRLSGNLTTVIFNGNGGYEPMLTIEDDGVSPVVRVENGISFLLNTTNVAGALAEKQPLDADLTRVAGIGAGASGDILYRDATGWTNLVKGADGEVLKLTSGLPSWETDSTAAGGESEGTVHATGTPAANELMMSADTTGTNLVPSGIITDGSGGQTNTTIVTDELITSLIDGAAVTNAPYVSASIVQVDDDAYAAGWNGSTNVPTKNAVYDKVELLATSASVTANTNLLHLNVGTLTVTNQFKTLWNNVTLDGTNAVLDLKLSPNFYWSTTTSNFLTFSNITAGAQGSILIYTPDSGGEQINFSSSINNLSTNRYAPVFQSTNQTWIGYSVTFGTDLTNVTVGITVK